MLCIIVHELNINILSTVPPLVHVHPTSKTVPEGQTTTFICNVSEAIPEAKVRWIHKEKVKVTSKLLKLSNVKKQTSEGNYTCIATNRAGSSKATAILNIDGKFKCYILHRLEIRRDPSNAVTVKSFSKPLFFNGGIIFLISLTKRIDL